jgi:multimeric flavodoxin WrbA
MAESVLIINGATRINGNTDILVEKIIDGAKNAGLNPNLVELKNKNISNCIGCYTLLNPSPLSRQENGLYLVD